MRATAFARAIPASKRPVRRQFRRVSQAFGRVRQDLRRFRCPFTCFRQPFGQIRPRLRCIGRLTPLFDAVLGVSAGILGVSAPVLGVSGGVLGVQTGFYVCQPGCFVCRTGYSCVSPGESMCGGVFSNEKRMNRRRRPANRMIRAGQPVPAKHAFGADSKALAVRLDQLEEVVEVVVFDVAVDLLIALPVHDADVPLVGRAQLDSSAR
jgi:hypothetical protein